MPEKTKSCGQPADYRYTWPGQDESRACYAHGREMARIAHALGFYLQLILLMPADPPQICEQQIKEQPDAKT
jgi:hypothetical protein